MTQDKLPIPSIRKEKAKMGKMYAVQVKTNLGWAWHRSIITRQYSIYAIKSLATSRAAGIRKWSGQVKRPIYTRVVEISKIEVES